MIRLLRRTLLCAIVGVTAFGMAGWGLRPQPRWETAINEPGFNQQFQFYIDDIVVGPPGIVWLWSARTGPNDKREDLLIGLDEVSGRVVRRICDDSAELCVPLADGRVLYLHEDRSGEKGTVAWTSFRLTHADGRPISKQRWAGLWERMPDGLAASGIERREGGASFVIRDIESGDVQRRLSLGETNDQTGEIDVSRDRKRLAVGERLFADRRAPFGVQLWDLERGTMIRRLDLPTIDASSKYEGATGTRLSDTRPLVFFDWNRPVNNDGTPSKWVWRFGSPKENDVAPELPPTAIKSDVKLRTPWVEDAAGHLWLWNTYDENRSQFWYGIQSNELETMAWRRYPFPIIPIEVGEVFFESFEPGSRLVPNTTALVFAAKERPAYDLLPATWRSGDWKSDAPDTRYLWHDWKANAWRDVGLRTSFTDIGNGFYDRVRMVRPDALLVIRDDLHDGTLVQSWPLPPRDPKWPALGVAAFFTAATWWVCAKRYARKLRRTA